MKDEDLRQCQLPKRRTGRLLSWLASSPTWLIGVGGLAMYTMVVLLVSAIEWSFSVSGDAWVKAADDPVVGWWDIVYFNFISILSIGYGDYSPATGGARLLTVIEALTGTGILGVVLAALTAKFLSPPDKAIVFSRHAYYCRDDEKLLVIFLNTTRLRLVNAEISSYFKLGGDWTVRPAVRSPLITRAVQTFFTDSVPEDLLVKRLDEASDAFRFALSGQLGAMSLSVAIEYKPADILVLRNRSDLISYPGFWDVDLNSKEFEAMFHYNPAEARALPEYVTELRKGHTLNP
jgi:hypothetical protein